MILLLLLLPRRIRVKVTFTRYVMKLLNRDHWAQDFSGQPCPDGPPRVIVGPRFLEFVFQ